ncbi:anti-sigma-I factor RsgI family protein [Haloplasma contractile]|uniref:Membrane lipoprotein n=1 Tax=Haloplasma contractile SSD-17B TaxID=1033810 RepID=U2EAP9_9MOLU|nr:hypothetical protein [Haloplasma contractile]ERJ11896.1 membrane lipoprotein [Haloplasma contractile SSD-17B]
MKKFKSVLLMLIVSLSLGLYGCNVQDTDNYTDTDNTSTTEQTQGTEDTTGETNEDEATTTTDSYVTTSINPSVGLIVDEAGTVVSVHPLNEDGEMLLLSIDLTNQHVDVALDSIINQSIELGYIDVAATDTTVDISVVGEDTDIESSIRQMVETKVTNKLAELNIPAHVREKVFNQADLDEAENLNVTPEKYELMKTAIMADPELTMEEAKELDSGALVEKVRENNNVIAGIAQSLKDDFLTEKQAVLDQYNPQIADLEAQIETATANGEDTTALEADLETLISEKEAALKAVVDNLVSQTTSIRDTMLQQRTNLIEQHRQKVEDFRNNQDGTDNAANTTNSYVTTSINPSVGLVVDEAGTIVSVHPLNEDGELLLLSIDLTNQHVDVALESIINQSIELGYIDVAATDTTVDISVVGEDTDVETTIRQMVETKVTNKLAELNIPAHVGEKVFDQTVLTEAQNMNVTPEKYELMKTAIMADPELTMEEAKELDSGTLVEKVRENNNVIAGIAQSLKDNFLTEKQAVLDQYNPQIADLEAQIETATANGEDTTELEANLETLISEKEAALQAVVDNLVSQTTSIRDTMLQQRTNLIEQHRQKVEDFRNRNNQDGTDNTTNTTNSYVTTSINPSVGLVVDEAGTVVAAHPLNEDGEVLLLNLDITNQHVDIVFDLIIDESIKLGYIDVTTTDTTVDISVAGKDLATETTIRDMVETKVTGKLAELNIPAHVRDKIFDQTVLTEAQNMNVTPEKYELMKTAILADPELTLDEAKDLDTEALVEKVRENNSVIAGIAQSLKDEFLVAKQAVLDQYDPQIADLEAQIDTATANGDDTTSLEADLEALVTEKEAALQAVVTDLVTQTTSIRDTMQQQYTNLIDQYRQKATDFLNLK